MNITGIFNYYYYHYYAVPNWKLMVSLFLQPCFVYITITSIKCVIPPSLPPSPPHTLFFMDFVEKHQFNPYF